jgi:alkanesulfonate monooxygenase SsuD/methylene tetrahydromethanopterin reductase-like flavin-dependent oxidoreductase (luciferase family)
LDVISNGRLDFGVGLGYRPPEYAGYGLDLKTRGARADEALQIIRRLWQGDTVTFHGKHFNIDGACLTPRPVQRPNPPIWVGGFSRAAARRAARYGDGYIGPTNRAVYEMYLAELRQADKDATQARVMGGGLWLVVAEDPDRTFAHYAPHLLYWFNSYAKWFEGTDTSPWPMLNDAQELRTRGLVNIVTPEAAVALIKQQTAAVPVEMFTFMLSPPGVKLSQVAPHLELFANKVMPHFHST